MNRAFKKSLRTHTHTHIMNRFCSSACWTLMRAFKNALRSGELLRLHVWCVLYMCMYVYMYMLWYVYLSVETPYTYTYTHKRRTRLAASAALYSRNISIFSAKTIAAASHAMLLSRRREPKDKGMGRYYYPRSLNPRTRKEMRFQTRG